MNGDFMFWFVLVFIVLLCIGAFVAVTIFMIGVVSGFRAKWRALEKEQKR